MVDIDELIAGARQPERTVLVCLRADLNAQIEDLERALRDAKEAARGSLADDGGVSRIQGQIADLHREAKEHTLVLRMRALNRYRVQQLVVDNPPREGVETDRRQGFNTDALQYHLIRECTYDPVLTDDQWARLIGTPDEFGNGVLSPRQFGELDEAVTALNFARVDIPFS